MADEVPTTVRTIVEKVLEADVKDLIAQRGRELATAVGDAREAVSERAAEAWKDSAPARRDAQKTVRRASRDAAKWGLRTWKRDVRPGLRQMWNRRTVAIGAATAAIPASREIVEDAAARLGIVKRREQRHWTAFFIGLLIGAAAGAIIALLTAPKPGKEIRDDLAVAARDAADRAREAAERAREAANGADWVPLFQREGVNGDAADPIEAVGDEVSEMTADVAEQVEGAAEQVEGAADQVDATGESEETH